MKESKRLAGYDDAKSMEYLARAERVETAYCDTLKKDRRTIEDYNARTRGFNV